MNRPGAYNIYCPWNRQEAAKTSSTSSRKRNDKKFEIEKNRLIQEEHKQFRDCEGNSLSLIRCLEDAAGNKSINGKDKSTTSEDVSTAVKVVHLRDNDVILSINTRNIVRNEELRKILHHVLLLGNPEFGQQFRAEMEKENSDRQVEITRSMFEEIRRYKDPPVRFLRLVPNTDKCFKEEEKEKVCSVLIHVVRRILREPQPRENDVLQHGGEIQGVVDFYDSRGKEKFREILKSEGYYEEYMNARLSHHTYRMERIIEVLNKVSGRVQNLSPPTRFLSRSRIEHLDENRRLLAINLILAQNEKQDDFSISGHADEPWSLDDTDKLKRLAIRTGKYEYFKQLHSLDGSQVERSKILVAGKLLFMIRLLNPCMRFVRRSKNEMGSGMVVLLDKVIEKKLIEIFREDKAASSTMKRKSISAESSGSNKKKYTEFGAKDEPQLNTSKPSTIDGPILMAAIEQENAEKEPIVVMKPDESGKISDKEREPKSGMPLISVNEGNNRQDEEVEEVDEEERLEAIETVDQERLAAEEDRLEAIETAEVYEVDRDEEDLFDFGQDEQVEEVDGEERLEAVETVDKERLAAEEDRLEAVEAAEEERLAEAERIEAVVTAYNERLAEVQEHVCDKLLDRRENSSYQVRKPITDSPILPADEEHDKKQHKEEMDHTIDNILDPSSMVSTADDDVESPSSPLNPPTRPAQAVTDRRSPLSTPPSSRPITAISTATATAAADSSIRRRNRIRSASKINRDYNLNKEDDKIEQMLVEYDYELQTNDKNNQIQPKQQDGKINKEGDDNVEDDEEEEDHDEYSSRRWSVEEHTRLVKAFSKYGRSPSKLQAFVKTRSIGGISRYISRHYDNVLQDSKEYKNCGLKNNEVEEEDRPSAPPVAITNASFEEDDDDEEDHDNNDDNDDKYNIGLWSIKEHQRLVEAFSKFGRTPSKLQPCVKTRSIGGIRSYIIRHYEIVLRDSKKYKNDTENNNVEEEDHDNNDDNDDKYNIGLWSIKERQRLVEAFSKFGRIPSKLQPCVKTRSIGGIKGYISRHYENVLRDSKRYKNDTENNNVEEEGLSDNLEDDDEEEEDHRDDEKQYNSGIWSVKEHKRLIEAFSKFGRTPSKLQSYVKTRSIGGIKMYISRHFKNVHRDIKKYKDRVKNNTRKDEPSVPANASSSATSISAVAATNTNRLSQIATSQKKRKLHSTTNNKNNKKTRRNSSSSSSLTNEPSSLSDEKKTSPVANEEPTIKQGSTQEPKQEVKDESTNNGTTAKNEETGDDPEIEVIYIDMSDESIGDNSEAAKESEIKTEDTDDDGPQIIDVDISDVSIGGGGPISCISKAETAFSTSRKANAIRIVRGSHEVTLPPLSVRKCTDGSDILKASAKQSVLDKSHLFIFSNDIKKDIGNKKKVVRYEFRGQNPTSAQFKLLSMDDILQGNANDDTVLITMSINEVDEAAGKVTLDACCF